MSAHQMVCHLCDAFRMALGGRPVTDVYLPGGSHVLKWAVLYLPVPWPSGLRTSPELDQKGGGTEPSSFDADVAEVEALMQRVIEQPEQIAWPKHPVFGRMSKAGWLRWGYLHMDHHLRQFGA